MSEGKTNEKFVRKRGRERENERNRELMFEKSILNEENDKTVSEETSYALCIEM